MSMRVSRPAPMRRGSPRRAGPRSAAACCCWRSPARWCGAPPARSCGSAPAGRAATAPPPASPRPSRSRPARTPIATPGAAVARPRAIPSPGRPRAVGFGAMERYICVTCGTQFGERDAPPPSCPICTDPRQYVGLDGQRWTTLAELAADHTNAVRDEHGLVGIGTEPSFAIGQRALLVPFGDSNLLWDCVTLLDDATAAKVERRGGLRAIAISHPHYYSAMVEWAHRFDCPILLHEDDREWVMRPDSSIVFWSGETHALGEGVTLVRLGGHFAGGTVLHRDGML